jgi:hypothetical protein
MQAEAEIPIAVDFLNEQNSKTIIAANAHIAIEYVMAVPNCPCIEFLAINGNRASDTAANIFFTASKLKLGEVE